MHPVAQSERTLGGIRIAFCLPPSAFRLPTFDFRLFTQGPAPRIMAPAVYPGGKNATNTQRRRRMK